tara:strand:- start:275 stop:517 length:243 start_codon:yes stop_codon:yes gene_type:complete
MKFSVSKDNSECFISFSNEELEIIKKNDNKLIFDAEHLPHLRNNLLRFVHQLSVHRIENKLSYKEDDIKAIDEISNKIAP